MVIMLAVCNDTPDFRRACGNIYRFHGVYDKVACSGPVAGLPPVSGRVVLVAWLRTGLLSNFTFLG